LSANLLLSQGLEKRTLLLSMRLDLFLKASRLCPRRTVAQKLCDAGLVTVAGRVAKPAHPVNLGDEITLKRRGRVTTVRVTALPEGRQTSREVAGSLVQVLNDEIPEGE
jgi:ribosomal 50S subunit-recycling heat shock protein